MRAYSIVSIQTRKTTAIRRIAVRETDVSRHHEELFKDPMRPHRTMVLESLRGYLTWLPICQETPVSRTAIRLIAGL